MFANLIENVYLQMKKKTKQKLSRIAIRNNLT